MTHEIRVLDELGSEFERVALRSQPRRQRLMRRWRPLALIAVLVLGGATGALAAAGVLGSGSPVKAASRTAGPSAGNGTVVRSGTILLGVRTADPAGGLPWGMRLTTTTRGLGCLEVGREQNGKLGVVGQDNAFDDDGKFHPLPPALSATSPECAALDRHGRLFLNVTVGNVPASALNASGLDVSGGCLGPDTHEPGGVFCALRDERTLYYGLLGPQATNLTYNLNGASHTLVPQGSDGAYLIVLPEHRESPGSINNSISGTLTPAPPITAVTYRSGLHCSYTHASPSPACQSPPGYAPTPTPHYTAAQLASPVRATARPAGHNRWRLTVSFIAHAPITNALSTYGVTLHVGSGRYGFSRPQNVRQGARITEQPLGVTALRPGTYHGTVLFNTSTTPGQPPSPLGPGNHTLVGRFTIHIP